MNICNYILLSINNYIRFIMNNKDKVNEVLFFYKHYYILKLFISLDDNLGTKIDDLLYPEYLKAG